MYTYRIFSQKKAIKEFLMVGNGPQNGDHPLQSEIFTSPNIGMWGVYPEALAWNVGAVHSDFNLNNSFDYILDTT